MNKQVFLENKFLNYELKFRKKSKRIRISVFHDSKVVVSLPFGFDENKVEKFIKEKFNWILDKIDYFKKHPVTQIIKTSKADYKVNKTIAKELAVKKVAEWNKYYNFKYNKVSIKNSKSRWGSCSKKGNLNFNYKIVKIPEKLVDYLVVHELCHLKEFNHSRKFWELVSQTIPDFKVRRLELKKLQ